MKNLAFTVEIPAAAQEKRRRLGYGTKVARDFFRGMKDVIIMLDELAEVTKYSREFIYGVFEETAADRGDWYEAWEEVRDISLEYDW